MDNNEITNAVDEIIDLTDVVSVGNAGDKSSSPSAEDDVLDSLVNDFEKNLGFVSESEINEEKEESDEPLDLAKLDNLINSYNIDFDAEDENPQSGQAAQDIDMQNGMEVAFVHDDRVPTMQPNMQTDAHENAFDEHSDIDAHDIPSFEDIDLPSLEEEHEDEIDVLTKDIIDGTNAAEKSPEQAAEQEIDVQKKGGDKSFSAVLNDEFAQQEEDGEQAHPAQAEKNSCQMTAPEISRTSFEEKPLKSDMAEDSNEINEDVFNNILNELSLDHETDEEVVPFAQEVSPETKPIHLKGNISFIEAQGKDKGNEDIHYVQSASKVLASDEAYLEKFNGEDDSVGAKIKNLSTKVVSLEQRLVGSDSKAQDNALELTYRINGLETKLTELQVAVNTELMTIKTANEKIDSLVEERKQQENTQEKTPVTAELTDKIQAIETRVATLDDIFSEQKMLNDELSKSLDSLMQNSGNSDSSHVRELEEKIAILENELVQAQAKIRSLEENIEKAASLAAAKVLREEIIPLLGQ